MWNFQGILVTIRPLRGQNFRSKFVDLVFRWTSALGQKSSKTVITQSHKCMGPNPLRVILVPGSSTCAQSMRFKAVDHFGRFPRQLFLFRFIHLHVKYQKTMLQWRPINEISTTTTNTILSSSLTQQYPMTESRNKRLLSCVSSFFSFISAKKKKWYIIKSE